MHVPCSNKIRHEKKAFNTDETNMRVSCLKILGMTIVEQIINKQGLFYY